MKKDLNGSRPLTSTKVRYVHFGMDGYLKDPTLVLRRQANQKDSARAAAHLKVSMYSGLSGIVGWLISVIHDTVKPSMPY